MALNNTLFLFDIDDTLTNSMSKGSLCFAQTYKELFGIENVSIDWSSYPHVTDWGLSYALFKSFLDRTPSKKDLMNVEAHYNKLLESTYEGGNSIEQVVGAQSFIDHLKSNGAPLALATGGWSYSAQLKLSKANYQLDHLPMGNSNDAWSRTSILESGIRKANAYYKQTFEKVIYFGDGLWDKATCELLNIPLIGIDIHQNGNLKSAGLEHVFENFVETRAILDTADFLLKNH